MNRDDPVFDYDDLIEREAAVPERIRMPELMTPNDINVAARAELAALLDHIYEYGTTSEGVMPLAMTFARAIETEAMRRVRDALRKLVAAGCLLSAESEEIESDDGMARCADLDYWHEFEEKLAEARLLIEGDDNAPL
ncbi:MAG: hypothetical protein WC972_02480 [Trueperaceae bacterium]